RPRAQCRRRSAVPCRKGQRQAAQVHYPRREMPEPPRGRNGVESRGRKRDSLHRLRAARRQGRLRRRRMSGGYPNKWVPKELASAASHVKLIVLQDILPSELSEAAAIVIPSCAWAEREGTFVNHAGLVQPFTAALPPPEGAHRDGQYLYAAVGFAGLYRAAKVREQMSAEIPEMAKLHVPPPKPVHLH